MSEENRVDELVKETPEDTTSKSPDDTTEDAVEEQQTDTSDSQDEEVDLQSKLQEIQARLDKAQEVNENYKKELNKYRKKSLDEPVSQSKEEAPEVGKIRENFASKKQDALEEFSEEINSLSEEQFGKVKNLIKATTENVLSEAVNQNRYVAQGELRKAISELISFAKGVKEPVNKAEMAKKDMAEISGVKSGSKSKSVSVSELDRQNAERTGRTPEQEKAIRLKKEERLKDYQVNNPLS